MFITTPVTIPVGTDIISNHGRNDIIAVPENISTAVKICPRLCAAAHITETPINDMRLLS